MYNTGPCFSEKNKDRSSPAAPACSETTSEIRKMDSAGPERRISPPIAAETFRPDRRPKRTCTAADNRCTFRRECRTPAKENSTRTYANFP